MLVISADALFGLPRKKAAGISHRNALHGSVFFGDQSEVDEYVASYNMTTTKVPKVCLIKYCNNNKQNRVTE